MMKRINAVWSAYLLFALAFCAIFGSINPGLFAQDSTSADAAQSTTAALESATAAVESATPAQADEAWISKCLPPLAFDRQRVKQARDQAKRVGWTDAIVDAQTGEPAAGESLTKADKVWRSCLKAALFGEKRRAEKAANDLLEWISTAAPAPNSAEFWEAYSLALQAYDCLTAISEWPELDAALRGKVAEQLQTKARTVLDGQENAARDNTQDALRASSLRLYAGLLSGATDIAKAVWFGSSDKPGFVDTVKKEIAPEGAIGSGSLRGHVESGQDFLLACAVLVASSTEAFAPIEPYARQSVEFIRDLIVPTGRFPKAARSLPERGALVRYLERGNALFDNLGLSPILNLYYKEKPRTAESLLIGGMAKAGSSSDSFRQIVMPMTGAVILTDASAAMPLYLDTGLSGGLASSALLAVEWRNETASPAGETESQGTDRFNTVVIDRMSQPSTPSGGEEARNGFIYSSKAFQHGAAYIRAIAAGQYTERAAYPAGTVSTPVFTYERALYVSPPFVVDLFRARGGRLHDWIYHTPAGIEKLINGEWSSYSVASGDYPWLTASNASALAANLKGVYGVSFNPLPGNDLRHRLWFIDPAGTQLISVKNGEGSSLIARREMIEDEGDLYAAVHEWRKGSMPDNVQIEPILLDPPANARGFQAIALAIVQGEETNIFLSSINPEAVYNGKYKNGQIVFQGAFGHILLRGETAERLRLAGNILRYDASGIQMKEALNIGVVRNVNTDTGAMETDFSNRLPANERLNGDTFTALTTQMAPVMYRTLVVEKVTASELADTAQLRYRPNTSDSQPGLGAPIRIGDQLIYENMAELAQTRKNYFTFDYSAPADVTIGGATDLNRVFLAKSQILRKVRGESTAGAIQFHIDPQEGVDAGHVEFYRIP